MILKGEEIWYCWCHPRGGEFPIAFNGQCAFCRTAKVYKFPDNVVFLDKWRAKK